MCYNVYLCVHITYIELMYTYNCSRARGIASSDEVAGKPVAERTEGVDAEARKKRLPRCDMNKSIETTY